MENVKELYSILRKAGNVVYQQEAGVIEIAGDSAVLESVEKLGFTAEILQGKTVRIEVYQPTLTIFIDDTDFITRVKSADFGSKILILNLDTNPLFYDTTTEQSYRDFELDSSIHFIQNAHYYYKLLTFIGSKEHNEDQAFYFVDHFNRDNRTIILTSLKKEGKLSIPFTQAPPDIEQKINLKKRYERFTMCFGPQNKHLPKFIKAECFNFLSKESKEKRMGIFINKMDDILNAAEQNHELFLSDLTLDNLKREYFDHKEKYFQQLRDILGKVSTQIIGLPLSITASAFAVYKVSDAEGLLWLVLAVFIIYSLYMFFLIRLYKNDLVEIGVQSKSDLKKIQVSSFFVKHPKELATFEKFQGRVATKTRILKTMVDAYYFTLLLTNTAYIIYNLYQLHISTRTTSIIATVIAIIGAAIWFVMEKKVKEYSNLQ